MFVCVCCCFSFLLIARITSLCPVLLVRAFDGPPEYPHMLFAWQTLRREEERRKKGKNQNTRGISFRSLSLCLESKVGDEMRESEHEKGTRVRMRKEKEGRRRRKSLGYCFPCLAVSCLPAHPSIPYMMAGKRGRYDLAH
ncbi:hypothetical protein B0T24DRAFT_31604 [Lasiosphaeria ovina]|uniref:Secreted protein n=1 Tax=Lasiosphaeria ovina TaxID=92902 RepID=A0AAE0TXE7_9PEZI|nr:hypothetical protein B0T24DRAFT_31604 [Lasiosphaeria ovina]